MNMLVWFLFLNVFMNPRSFFHHVFHQSPASRCTKLERCHFLPFHTSLNFSQISHTNFFFCVVPHPPPILILPLLLTHTHTHIENNIFISYQEWKTRIENTAWALTKAQPNRHFLQLIIPIVALSHHSLECMHVIQ